MAERLTCVDVRHVQFDNRAGEDRQRVADAIAVVGPGACIDEHAIDSVGEALVDPIAHCAFTVGLEAFDFSAQFLAQRTDRSIDFFQCDGAVVFRVAFAEHVVVDAVEQKNFH